MSQRTVVQTSRARALRASQTAAETKLWFRLRGGRLNGYKFVRQQPIGSFVVDFCCRTKMLVVEIDGATHSTEQQLSRDARRTKELLALGYRVCRFQNAEVADNLDGVWETILAHLEHRNTV